MTYTITSTGKFRVINGVRCEIWHGLTMKGEEVWVYVAGVGTPVGSPPPRPGMKLAATDDPREPG